MSRSISKGPFVHPSILKKVGAMNQKGVKDPIQTWSEASIASASML